MSIDRGKAFDAEPNAADLFQAPNAFSSWPLFNEVPLGYPGARGFDLCTNMNFESFRVGHEDMIDFDKGELVVCEADHEWMSLFMYSCWRTKPLTAEGHSEKAFMVGNLRRPCWRT